MPRLVMWTVIQLALAAALVDGVVHLVSDELAVLALFLLYGATTFINAEAMKPWL